MKATNIEERLTLIAALVVLVGVTFAAGDALADDTADITTTAVEIHDAADNTIEIAEEANRDAANRAAESLAKEAVLALDIRLEDHSSTLVAGRN